MQERLALHPWLEHYEVVVRRNGSEYLVARAATRRSAEWTAYSISRRTEISRSSVSMRRVRGIHPANAAKACMMLIMAALLLPWFWPRVVLALLGGALMLGVMSSGFAWRQGGADDR